MLVEVGLKAKGFRMADDNVEGRKLRLVDFPEPKILGSIYVG